MPLKENDSEILVVVRIEKDNKLFDGLEDIHWKTMFKM